MSLRRAVGFLLTQRFSPRVIPRTAPARSFHTLKELPIGRGAAGVGLAAAAFAGAGAWAVQHFRKGPDDIESAARKEEQDTKASFENWMKEEDMTARFENWMKEYNKTYGDEEEKAMRFRVFKDTVKSIESLPPSTHKKFLPPNGFADLTSEELPCIQPCIDDDLDDPDSEEYRQNKFLAENENAADKKEEDMTARFENWMKEFNKTYRDEEEEAMRFQVFKDTVKWIKSRPPSTQEVLLPPNCFADLTREEPVQPVLYKMVAMNRTVLQKKLLSASHELEKRITDAKTNYELEY